MNKKAQIAIEFLMLIGIAFFVIISLLISLVAISTNQTKLHVYATIEDLGKSLQQEFFLAAELEDGYTRKINLPMTVDGKTYGVSIVGSIDITNPYSNLILSYDNQEIYYLIPPVNGTLILGDNILVKNNGSIKIN